MAAEQYGLTAQASQPVQTLPPPAQNPNWNFADERRKLLALGVKDNDTSDLAAIAQIRYDREEEIAGRLNLQPSDIVLDLGSGMGFVAEVIAPKVKRLYCADISETYLADCSARLARFGNVSCRKIEYADLSSVRGLSINKAYSTLLFIHFTFYELVYYLRQMNHVLVKDGLFYFDYNDGERYFFGEPTESFHGHLDIYHRNRQDSVFQCMHMLSPGMVRNIAGQLGFTVVETWSGPNAFTRTLLQKTSELPEAGNS